MFFKFLRFEEKLRSFYGVDGGPNQGKKAVLSNFSGMDTAEALQNKFPTENRSYIIHLSVRAVFN